MRVTIKQIAERSGVSQPTVSRVLSGNTKSPPPPHTRERVLRAAQELGYRPNSSARAISTGRFYSVGLLLSTAHNVSRLSTELLSGIHNALHKHNLHLVIAQMQSSDLENPETMPKVLREWSVDGLLVNYTHYIPPAMHTCLRENDVPFVWINSKQEVNCVHPDDFGAARAATEHLIQLGHRRITYITDAMILQGEPHYSVIDRQAGYEAAMLSAGLPPDVFVGDYGTTMSTEQQARRKSLLTRTSRPTALLSYARAFVEPLVHTALTLGLHIPRDLSVVVLDFEAYHEWLLDAVLSTWEIPNENVGRLAVANLLQLIENPEAAQPRRAVPFTFVPGETCLPAPSH